MKNKLHISLLLCMILNCFLHFGLGKTHHHYDEAKVRDFVRKLLKHRDANYRNGDDRNGINPEDLPKNGEIFEGDIQMDNDLRNAVLGYNSKRSAVMEAEVGHEKHWPGGIVPYLISDGVDPDVKQQIKKAISILNTCTCIRYVPKKEDEEDYVVFKDGKGCSSAVGRQTGEQSIHLASGCQRIGTVLHEMMHAIGIIHEQSRADRDEFLKVEYKNIKKNMMHNFHKYSYIQSDNMDIPYNYNSIMHYSNHAFSRNDEDTLVAKVDPDLRFGQRTQITHYDIKQINNLYPCPMKRNFCAKESDKLDLMEDMTAKDVIQRRRDEEFIEDLLTRY